MSLRLPLIDESGGPLYTVFRWTRHSRARGVRHRISLDTRFCGYDGIQVTSGSHPGMLPIVEGHRTNLSA
jgi:hypothetical protein